MKNGIPVVANPQGPCDFTEYGHYVVLCGIDNNGNISVNDPNGNHYNMSKSIIIILWRDCLFEE